MSYTEEIRTTRRGTDVQVLVERTERQWMDRPEVDTEKQLRDDALALADDFISTVHANKWSQEQSRFRTAFTEIGRRRWALDHADLVRD